MESFDNHLVTKTFRLYFKIPVGRVKISLPFLPSLFFSNILAHLNDLPSVFLKTIVQTLISSKKKSATSFV
jgi:hypothetical protein